MGSKKQRKIIVTRGIPASGKSTWAKQFVKDNEGWVRVSRDDIRIMLDNYKSVGDYEYEKTVDRIEKDTIKTLIHQGKNVIVDVTCTRVKYLREYITLANEVGAKLNVQQFNIDYEEAVKRNASREMIVPEDVMVRMYNTINSNQAAFETELSKMESPKPLEEVKYDDNLLDCIIVDFDRTLSKLKDRTQYEWEKVHQDIPKNTIDLFSNLSFFKEQYDDIAGETDINYKVFIVTGRDACCYEQSEHWLFENSINFDQLYMRPRNDTRRTTMVKKEIYMNEIRGKYNVIGVFDDDEACCQMYKNLGLPVFKVL